MSDENNILYSLISFICICSCISLSIIFSFIIYKTQNSSKNSTQNSTQNSSNNSLKSLSNLSLESNTSSKNNVVLPISIAKSNSNSKQIDCYINNNISSCTHPINDKKIFLKSGPLFKLSSSVDIDYFNKSTTNYYILASLSFLTEGFSEVATKEIIINTLDDLLTFFNNMENQFVRENTIPDKCLGVSTKIREESKDPYNTVCIFYPGLNTIHSIVDTLEKALLPFLSDKVLIDYYNMIESKLTNISELTILEYTMYLALLNKIKNSQFKYFTLCESDNNVNC